MLGILVVCTGNICRSPMAEGLLAHRLSELGVDAHVSSAGTSADGWEVTEEAVVVTEARGVDIAGHLSRKLSFEIVSQADLIIAMEPHHVVAAVEVSEDAWTKTFTLRELANRAERIGPRPTGVSVIEWISEVGRDRERGEMFIDAKSISVADPYGGDLAEYQDTVALIDLELNRVVSMLWPGVLESNL